MADANRPRHKSENEVWDPILLEWVPMQQPILNAGSVTISGSLTQGPPGNSPWLVDDIPGHVTALDFVGTTNPVYIGLAAPNSSTSDPVWQIRKLTYDGLLNPTNIQFAGGTAVFNQVWDNRAALTYS